MAGATKRTAKKASASGGNFIKGAIKHPGALRAKAKAAGALNPDGTIKQSWLNAQSKGNSTTAKQARLAKTLKGMKH